MAVGDNRPIEEAVVRISPDLKGFRRELLAGLKTAGAGVELKAKISPNLVGFRKDLRDQLRSVNVVHKVKVEADARHLYGSIRTAVKKAKLRAEADGDDTVTIKLDVDEGAAGEKASRLHRQVRNRIDQEEQAYERARAAEREQRTLSFEQHLNRLHEQARQIDRQRVAGHLQAIARAEEQAYAEERRRLQVENDAQTRIAERAENERQRRIASLRRKYLTSDRIGPKIIDLGGEGVRPMNALYGAAALLSPALVAVGASALQASFSVAALGSASIGAVLGITAITIGFGRLTDALKLREQVRKESLRTSAQTADLERQQAEAIKNALRQVEDARRSVRDATRNYADAQRAVAEAERDALRTRLEINKAYQEARRDLEDLRESVSDLARDEVGAQQDVQQALQEQAALAVNAFATDLQRQQAAQKLADAQDRLSDIQRDRKRKTEELNTSERKGIDNAEKVIDARERARDADRRLFDQRRQLEDANLRVQDSTKNLQRAEDDLKNTRSGQKGPVGPQESAAAAQLREELEKMSPAAREMYYWFERNQKVFDGFRKKIEQATLPGFLKFLEDVTDKGKDGESTLSIVVDQIAAMGKIIGGTVAKLGELSKTPLFRKAMKTIGRENAKAFGLLGDALVKMAGPVAVIIAAAAPLFTKFSGGLLTLATRFDSFITKAQKSGALKKFFDDSAASFKRWMDLGGEIFELLKTIFNASNPTGGSLVERLTSFIREINDKLAQPGGLEKMTKFFEFFRDLKYGEIGKLLLNLTLTIGAFKAVRYGIKHPFVALLTLLATSDLATSGAILDKLSKAALGLLKFASDNPVAISSLLALFLAGKGLGKLADIGIKLPGVDNLKNYLTGKFKFLDKLLGGSTTPVMNVRANVVNVYGRVNTAPTPGARPGAPPVVAGGRPGGGLGGKLLGATGIAAVFLAGIAFIDQIVYNQEGIRRFFAMDLPNWLFAGERGWSSFENAFENTFGKNAVRFFSMTLPEALNPSKGEGWAGLGRNLQRFFSMDMPNFLSGRSNGWAGLGMETLEQFSEAIGWPAMVGLWKGISEGSAWLWTKITGWWAWLKQGFKDLFGIKSPSTVFAGFGVELINGLYKGFVDRWNGIWTSVQTFVTTRIVDPLKTAFRNGGNGIRDAFVSAFSSLTMKLVGPVNTVLGWIDRNVIGKVNTLLKAIGVDAIPLIGTVAPVVGPQTPAPRVPNLGPPITSADGGRVPGFSPNPRADNIPAMLTANEYVQPVDTVRHYGVGFMDRLRRKEIPLYADGGLVGGLTGSTGDNLISRIGGAAIKRAGGSISGIFAKAKDWLTNMFFGSDPGGGQATGDLNVARIAEATARALGASDKQLLALMAAGYVESEMQNLNYGDRDSVGFLQQRPSQGWGTPAQLMNVAYATRKFIEAAKSINDASMGPGELAQAVQRSAYPDKYAMRVADAYAVLNREAPGVGGVGPIGGFPPWPSSPGAQRGNTGVWRRIVSLIQSSGIREGSFGNAYRDGDPKWHGSGRAVDWMGFNMDALATFLANQRPLELIHRTRRRDYAYTRGVNKGSFDEALMENHRNHIHIAMAEGGLVARKYDNGGILPPGVTLAVNQTRKNEYIRTNEQERAMTQSLRLDRRDLVSLAGLIASAVGGQQITMDGRKVAETVNGYDYVPRGF